MNTDLLVSVLKRAAQSGATAADGFLIEKSHFRAPMLKRGSENTTNLPERVPVGGIITPQ